MKTTQTQTNKKIQSKIKLLKHKIRTIEKLKRYNLLKEKIDTREQQREELQSNWRLHGSSIYISRKYIEPLCENMNAGTISKKFDVKMNQFYKEISENNDQNEHIELNINEILLFLTGL